MRGPRTIILPRQAFARCWFDAWRRVERSLIARFNGKLLPIATDTRLAEAEMGFQTRHLIRDSEALNLDGLSESEALKLVALDPQGKPLLDGKTQ